NGASYQGIARLNTDGTLDSTFHSTPVLGPYKYTGDIYSIVLQTNGQALIAGRFVSVDGAAVTNLARLNADGTRDSGFQAAAWGGTGNQGVNAMVLQNDGKIILAGEFDTVNGDPKGHIARINPDGSLDPNFQAAVTLWGGSAGAVWSLALQRDGKVLVGGLFTEVNGQTRTAIARLNPDSTLDSTFMPLQFPITSEASIASIVLQTNGAIIISGGFPSVGGHTNILRLNVDGTLDDRFMTVYGADRLALQPNQQLLVGPTRLWAKDFPPVLQPVAKSGSTMNLAWHAIPDRAYQVQYAVDPSMGNWTNWAGPVAATSDFVTQAFSLPQPAAQMFFRVLELP
ncbi:MAG TPA: delta-60 repeat domain-containing protein, partial [Patescibacteria group bacterium]|nr:delta-60 repeat domain-containing protein [Patescibacteria group bacterium]